MVGLVGLALVGIDDDRALVLKLNKIKQLQQSILLILIILLLLHELFIGFGSNSTQIAHVKCSRTDDMLNIMNLFLLFT